MINLECLVEEALLTIKSKARQYRIKYAGPNSVWLLWIKPDDLDIGYTAYTRGSAYITYVSGYVIIRGVRFPITDPEFFEKLGSAIERLRVF